MKKAKYLVLIHLTKPTKLLVGSKFGKVSSFTQLCETKKEATLIANQFASDDCDTLIFPMWTLQHIMSNNKAMIDLKADVTPIIEILD